MRYYQTIRLKDGRECVLRAAGKADAQAVYDNFNRTHGETEYLLSYPEENSFDISQEGCFLEEKERSAREVELCAVVEDRIVGTAGIEGVGTKEKVRHRAELGISVEKTHWGLGIGKGLTLACIACARKAGYSQLELDVVSDNQNAVSLYKSVGFVEYGRNPKGFRTRSGVWQELLLMRLDLEEKEV